VSFAFADAANRKASTEGPSVLEVNGIRGEDFEDVSFSVRAGEVIGLCGATSSGRLGVAEAVAGLGPYEAGTIRVNGVSLRSGDVPSALALGIGCVPKSRHKQGLVLTQSIADNVTMPIANALGPLGFIAPARRASSAKDAIEKLGVVTQGPDQLVSDLSGGNQQKVVMGRALSSRPSVLVLIDPTAGVDVKSKEALLRVIENTRRDGRAILLASGELEDLRVCDRVLVMRHGKVVVEHAAGWNDSKLVASVEGI
jgi:simple sugar transport system ATP-binding protein